MDCPAPTGGFYFYPSLVERSDALHAREISSDSDLVAALVTIGGLASLPGRAFGDDPRQLRLRLSTGLLFGASTDEIEAALDSDDPMRIPSIGGGLDRLRAGFRAMLADDTSY